MSLCNSLESSRLELSALRGKPCRARHVKGESHERSSFASSSTSSFHAPPRGTSVSPRRGMASGWSSGASTPTMPFCADSSGYLARQARVSQSGKREDGSISPRPSRQNFGHCSLEESPVLWSGDKDLEGSRACNDAMRARAWSASDLSESSFEGARTGTRSFDISRSESRALSAGSARQARNSVSAAASSFERLSQSARSTGGGALPARGPALRRFRPRPRDVQGHRAESLGSLLDVRSKLSSPAAPDERRLNPCYVVALERELVRLRSQNKRLMHRVARACAPLHMD